MQVDKKIEKLATVALVLYIICLVWIITLKCNMIQPVVESRYFSGKMSFFERVVFSTSKFAKTSTKDLIANVLVFVPLGLLIPFLKKEKPYISTALFGFALSLGFEVLQIINCIGGFTYIDILANSLGAILGAIAHFHLREKMTEKQIVTALTLCAVLCAVVVSFGFFNTVKHFDIYVTKDLGKYL